MQLHKDYEKFIAKDTIVVAIGPENQSAFLKYWEENELPFYGISDEKHEVLKLYGQKVNLFKLGRMPAQMLIDKNGMLRFIHYGHNMKDIPDNQEILSLIDSL